MLEITSLPLGSSAPMLGWIRSYFIEKLKADRPHLRDYSTGRQRLCTDNDSSLLFAALGKAGSLISTAVRQKVDLDPWPWPRPLTLTLKQGNSEIKTRFKAFDLDLWPMTLTYNPNLAKVGRTDATKYIISLTSRSIII